MLQKIVIKNTLYVICLLAGVTAFAQQKKATNISLLLPFSSKQLLADANHPNGELGNLCREFYQGALIALDSFERAQISVRLSVFDTEDDSLTTVAVTQKTAFKESELVIGPVRSGGNKVVSVFAKNNQVYHVSPLMTLSKTKVNDPYWIASNPDLTTYAALLLKQITTLNPAAQITVVADKSVTGKSIGNAFKQLATDAKLKIKVVDYLPGFTITPHVLTNTNNHIVVASTNEQIVTNILRSIKDTSQVMGLHTYGFVQWLSFTNVDYNLMQRCNAYIVSPFYVNYQHDAVKQFVEAYRSKFKTEPTEASFKGYDQLLLLGYAITKNGKKGVDDLIGKPQPMLGTTYHFVKQKEGWLQNNYLNLLKLEDYTLKKIN